VATGTAVVNEVFAEVVSVTDGDTVRVLMPNGTEEPIRLIGIDAPEDGSILAEQATVYLEGLVRDKRVRLVMDVSDRDRFDRLLRYVYGNAIA
jgi:micrococcal nuclease